MLALVNSPNDSAPAELREVAEPSAAPSEAVVEVHAFSLNRGELALLANRPEGWRPGQDISGVVVEEAQDGSGPQAGERVLGLAEEGGWAQRVAVPTSRLAALPDEVGFAEAAAVPMAGITALRAMQQGGFLLGRRVLVSGASGGVGHLAVQLAARAGAGVTGVVSRPERGEGLRELGADEVVTATEDASGPFDLILESVGGSSLSAALGLVGAGGTVVAFGNSSGEDTPVNFFDFGRLYPEGGRLQFFFHASGAQTVGADLAVLASLVAAGNLKPQIGAEESWRDLGQTVAALRERRLTGKAVFHLD